jgi:Aminoglycoside adenylyltransferase, C-terminal domain
MCRGLRTCRTGAYVSKREVAHWASTVLPEHAALIAEALRSRQRSANPTYVDDAMTQASVRGFVTEVQRQVR